jgi:hypothetical protein
MNGQQQTVSMVLANPLMNVLALPSFNSVAAGADATLDIPGGPLYKRLIIEYAGVTLAQLKNIEIRQNGTAFQTYRSGTELNKVDEYYDHATASGYIAIDFEDYDAFTIGGIDMYGWQTNPLASNFATGQLKVSIDAGAAAPVLKAYYEAPQSNDGKPRRCRTVRPFEYNNGATGDFEISDLPKGERYSQLARVFFHTANISNLKLRLNNVEQFDIPEALNDVMQTDAGRTPDASTFVFDPSAYSHRRTGAIISTVGISDFRFVLTMSGTGAIPVSAEYREYLP